jgi:hypothetical protein
MNSHETPRRMEYINSSLYALLFFAGGRKWNGWSKTRWSVSDHWAQPLHHPLFCKNLKSNTVSKLKLLVRRNWMFRADLSPSPIWISFSQVNSNWIVVVIENVVRFRSILFDFGITIVLLFLHGSHKVVALHNSFTFDTRGFRFRHHGFDLQWFPIHPHTQRNQPSSNSRLTRSTAIAWFDPLKTLPSRFLRLFPSPRFESKSLQTSPSMSCIFRFDFSSLQLSVHLTVNNSLVTILLFSWLEVLCVKRCFLSSSPCFPPKNVEKFSHVNFKKI